MKWCLNYYRFTINTTRIVIAIAIWGLFGCEQSRYITPPTQTINATLNSAAAEGSAKFSHDGRYLVYTSDRNAQRSVFLYDLQRRRLISLPGLNQPGSMQFAADISADGRYLVYVSEQLGKTDIFLYNRQTAKAQNLTKNLLAEVRNPSISGNGRFVAFESNRSGQWDIEIYDRGVGIDLSQPRNLLPIPENNQP